MKKFIKLFIIPVVLVLTYSCVSDDDSRFKSDPESGWIEFLTAKTTVAVTSRSTTVSVPVQYTAPINSTHLVVSYNIVHVTVAPSDVATELGSSLTITPNNNRTSIEYEL